MNDSSANTAIVRAVQAATSLLTSPPDGEGATEQWSDVEEALRTGELASTPLGQLTNRLALGRFELQLLSALLAFQLEPRVRELATQASESGHVTQGLVLNLLCRTTGERLTAQAALRPDAPLVSNFVVTVAESEEGLPGAKRIGLAPALRNFLLSDPTLSARVAAVARFVRDPFELLDVIVDAELRDQARALVVSHERVRRYLNAWGTHEICPYGSGVTFLFSGPSGTGKTLFARGLATHMDAALLAVSCADLPDEGTESVLRDVFAEARMRQAVVLFDECEALFGTTSKKKSAGLNALDYYADGVVVLVSNHPEQLTPALERRILLHVPFERPTAAQRRQIWEVHLTPAAPLSPDVELDLLADRYELTGGQIKNALQVAATHAVVKNPEAPAITMALLERGCRSQLRSTLDDLTTRTRSTLRLGDIVLPDKQQDQVDSLVAAVRNHGFVMNTWGLNERLATGTGIVALFDGPPGTGKTLCAEILAGEIGQPLHRINLPQVVSKWVGETEKHIQSIFREARASRAMLLFDEADSLFAARTSDVKGANDRAANMEVNLLLQEIERFPGVAILTTNSWGAMDPALMRRILFRVRFEEPDEGQRERIWGKLCGHKLALAEDADFGALARGYEFSGGRIKNAMLKAAYEAARLGSVVTQAILVGACDDEAQAAGLVIRDPARRAADLKARKKAGPSVISKKAIRSVPRPEAAG